MKSKCKLCGKIHNKVTIDLMSATKRPRDYCSDFCHNVVLMNNLPTNQKEFAYIKCTNSHLFRGKKYAKVGRQVVKIEHVFEDGIEISRPKGSNEADN